MRRIQAAKDTGGWNIKRMTHSHREKHAKLSELLQIFRQGLPIFEFSDRKEFLKIDAAHLQLDDYLGTYYPGLSGRDS